MAAARPSGTLRRPSRPRTVRLCAMSRPRPDYPGSRTPMRISAPNHRTYPMTDPGAVSLYTDKGPKSTFGIVLGVGCVGFGLWVLWSMTRPGFGDIDPKLLFIGLVFLLIGGGYALFCVQKRLDVSPQITLTPAGLIDHRKNPERFVAWSDFATFGTVQNRGRWSVSFFPPDATLFNAVRVDGTFLAITPDQMVQLIGRYAPGLEPHNRVPLVFGA
jgi:hypothetical protein